MLDLLFMQLYGKADIKYAVAARADEKPLGCATLLFEDAVEAVFIAAFRAYIEFVFELDFLYFSIHYFTCFTPRPKENNQPPQYDLLDLQGRQTHVYPVKSPVGGLSSTAFNRASHRRLFA